MTGELAQLGSTIRDFLTEQAPSSRVREIMESESGLDAQTWDRLSRELGVVGLTVPEEFGGADAGFDVATVVLGELGRALTPVPYLSHLLAVEAILSSSDTALHKELLPEIAAGTRIAAIAVAEGTTAQAFAITDTIARPAAGEWTLDGEKTFVLDAQAADLILVSARIEGEGLAWFAVDSSAVECLPLAAYDLTRRQCRVRLVSCPARRLAGTGEASVRRVLDMAALALAVEELGGAAACLDAATEYAKVRVQFGRAIGSFQAVKHRLADMLVELELTRSLVEDCVSTVASKREDVSLLGSLARVSANSTYQRIAGDNIQVHGGIGYTWEHDAQLYFKRAFSGAGLFGTLDQHRDNLAARVA